MANSAAKMEGDTPITEASKLDLPPRSRLQSRTLVRVCALLVILALALHASIVYEQVYSGYPYEEWDEIGSSNNAAVLDEPETLRVYSYGSLDTFWHILAHFYYQKFDSVGKSHLRHSYSNNVLESIQNPFLVHGDKIWEGLDYNYFRGLADRQPVFIARKIYFVVTYTLTAALTLFLLWHFGAWGLCIAAPLGLYLCSALFVAQSALALPNAINGVLALTICVLVERAVSLGSGSMLIAASAVLAAAINMKLDALLIGLPILLGTLTLSIQHYSAADIRAAARQFRYLARTCSMSFLLAMIMTKPSLLWRPVEDIGVQVRTLIPVVDLQKDLNANLAVLSSYLHGLLPTWEGIQSAPLLLPCAVFALVLLAVLTFKAPSERAFGVRQVVVVSILVLTTAWLIWIPTYTAAQKVYLRYYVSGTGVAALAAGYILFYLSTSRMRALRIIGAVGLASFVFLGSISLTTLYQSLIHSQQQRLALGGLDPAHNRNKAVFRLTQMIEQGQLSKTVLVDQHAYIDQRYFLLRKIKVRYVNIYNYRKVLKRISARAGANKLPVAVIYIRADGGWGGEAGRMFASYFQTLDKLPRIFSIEGHTMSTLSPDPPHPHMNVQVADASAFLTSQPSTGLAQ